MTTTPTPPPSFSAGVCTQEMNHPGEWGRMLFFSPQYIHNILNKIGEIFFLIIVKTYGRKNGMNHTSLEVTMCHGIYLIFCHVRKLFLLPDFYPLIPGPTIPTAHGSSVLKLKWSSIKCKRIQSNNNNSKKIRRVKKLRQKVNIMKYGGI